MGDIINGEKLFHGLIFSSIINEKNDDWFLEEFFNNGFETNKNLVDFRISLHHIEPYVESKVIIENNIILILMAHYLI